MAFVTTWEETTSLRSVGPMTAGILANCMLPLSSQGPWQIPNEGRIDVSTFLVVSIAQIPLVAL